jgi:hypothetical protein
LPEGGENVKVRELRSHLGKLGRLKEMKTMTAYLIADVKVTENGWVPAYTASVHDIVHKHGGKYLRGHARGRGGGDAWAVSSACGSLLLNGYEASPAERLRRFEARVNYC